MLKSCKFCGANNLHWNWNLLKRGWELLDAHDNKHKCTFITKSARNPSIDLKNDPKIDKALKEFKKTLDREKNKVYYLKRY